MLSKKSPRRIHEDDAIYFATSKTQNNFPFFREEILGDLWIAELSLVKQIKKFELYAFCLLPDHFHILLRPRSTANLSEVMRSFKTNFSRNANRVLGFSDSPFPLQARSRDRAHKNSTHKNIAPLLAQADVGEKLAQFFLEKHGANNHFPKFAWQKSFHDHGLRGECDFENHFVYCTQNFIKHGLAANWKFTSLNFPELIDLLG